MSKKKSFTMTTIWAMGTLTWHSLKSWLVHRDPFLDLLYVIPILVFPKIEVPPKHPKMIIFSRKTPCLLGKPTIFGNIQYNWVTQCPILPANHLGQEGHCSFEVTNRRGKSIAIICLDSTLKQRFLIWSENYRWKRDENYTLKHHSGKKITVESTKTLC